MYLETVGLPGSGKSTVTDELWARWRAHAPVVSDGRTIRNLKAELIPALATPGGRRVARAATAWGRQFGANRRMFWHVARLICMQHRLTDLQNSGWVPLLSEGLVSEVCSTTIFAAASPTDEPMLGNVMAQLAPVLSQAVIVRCEIPLPVVADRLIARDRHGDKFLVGSKAEILARLRVIEELHNRALATVERIVPGCRIVSVDFANDVPAVVSETISKTVTPLLER